MGKRTQPLASNTLSVVARKRMGQHLPRTPVDNAERRMGKQTQPLASSALSVFSRERMDRHTQ